MTKKILYSIQKLRFGKFIFYKVQIVLGIMLDVAIGLIFAYVLLSLICSGIVEFLSAIFKFRARNLQKIIENILGSHTKEFWKQPLIKSSSHPSKKPSYIPVENFVETIENMILSGFFDKNDKTNFKEVLKKLIEGNGKHMCISPKTESSGFENTIAYFLYKSSSVEEFRRDLGKWYENVRYRAQGWYKRRILKWLFAFGFILALLGNVDTMQITETLYVNSILRDSIVKQATEFWEQHNQQGENSTGSEKEKIANVKLNSKQNAKGKQDFIAELDTHLKILPIGWHGRSFSAITKSPLLFFEKILGWLITAVAVSFGAPFWFDLLGKLVNLRSTGRKPEGIKERDERK